MNTNPGWYPDPAGQPGQRYHDGHRWTEHFTPTPPAHPAPQAVAVAVSHGGGTSHGLHLVLTLLTCGLWLPIWALVAIFGGGPSSAVAVAGNGSVVRTGNRRPLIALAVFGVFFLMGLVAQHPWLLVVLAVIGVLAGVGFWALRAAQQREEHQRREQFQRDMLAQRADREDRLFQQGDPRGVHGQYLPPEFPR
ncbi:DUF2510 domain-containing protein [Mycobacterium sp. NPDC003323]